MPQPKYYTRFRTFSPFRTHFMFFDTEEYLADILFIRQRITVKFKEEFKAPNSPYMAIFCSVRKKDEDKFIEALRELPDKMILFGYTDYLSTCTNFFEDIKSEKKGLEPLSEDEERKHLLKKYPFLRINDSDDSHLDCMPRGWRLSFGSELCKEIRKALDESDCLSDYTILQVKEKYGALRWYDAGGPAEVSKIVEKYARISEQTCIRCGKLATRITTGWICPFCDDCLPKGHDGQPRPSVPIEEYYTFEGRASCEADGSSEKAEQKGSA